MRLYTTGCVKSKRRFAFHAQARQGCIRGSHPVQAGEPHIRFGRSGYISDGDLGIAGNVLRAGGSGAECAGDLPINIPVILTAADLLSAALDELSPDIRSMMDAHFFDGDSTFRIQRQRHMKRRDVETVIGAALETMRISLRLRGVRGFGDVM